MNSVSTRCAPALIAILLPAVVVMLVQQTLRSPVDDCADPSALIALDAALGTTNTKESFDKHDEIRIQWTEGSIPVDAPHIDPLRFRIVRSYNPKPLYRAPENFLPERIDKDWGELVRVEADGIELPVHKVYGHDDADVLLGSYLFIYDSHPVEDPYATQLRDVVGQLISGGHPLTLVAISGNARGDRFAIADRAALDWLERFWKHYQAVCLR